MVSALQKRTTLTLALCAGGTAFVLVLLTAVLKLSTLVGAGIVALACAVLGWLVANRVAEARAKAMDLVIARLAKAAHGDFDTPVPEAVRAAVPALGEAMDGLFQQIGAHLDSVHRMALYDPVTTLPNRTHFRRTAERVLAELPAGVEAALLFIDLDRFKIVNDTMGHATGDMLLGMVANRLRAVADSLSVGGDVGTPLIGRLAGDEFTMFFPRVADRCHALKIGRGLLYALAEPFDLGGTEVSVGASVGVAVRPDHGTTLHDLMRAADAAMYHAKASGRGRSELFSEELAAEIADRAQLELDLRSGIDRNEFALVYQPQVSLTDGSVVAAEALLRWRHPVHGIRLPDSFLRRAEETGLIVEIGDWTVQEVARTIRRWGDMGVERRLAVNISRRQLDHASFFRRLREAMHATQAPARLLELEITETLAMHCSDDVIEAIVALRADGATIAIDDYGTGSSSLTRMRTLPIDRVKLDRSLTEQVADRADVRLVAQSVIGLIHGLGCEAVAEGVEQAEQAEVLRIIGCDVVQGYAYAPPMDEAAFLAWAQGPERTSLAG